MLNNPADIAALLHNLDVYEYGSMQMATLPGGVQFALDDRASPELVARIQAAGGTVSESITVIGD